MCVGRIQHISSLSRSPQGTEKLAQLRHDLRHTGDPLNTCHNVGICGQKLSTQEHKQDVLNRAVLVAQALLTAHVTCNAKQPTE